LEEAAAGVRRLWGLGLGPLDNMAQLLESRGVFLENILQVQKIPQDIIDSFKPSLKPSNVIRIKPYLRGKKI
jgi:hypothetical protein